jgi:hypothetical protein
VLEDELVDPLVVDVEVEDVVVGFTPAVCVT